MPSAVIEKVRKERPRDYLKVAVAGVGSMSSTISDGRHNFTPRGVMTIGRLMSMGLANMASMS